MKMGIVAIALGAFALGIVGGGLGATRYSQQRFGHELLRYVHRDSAQQIANYEKVKELIATGDEQRVTRFIDDQIELARLSMRAANASATGEGPGATPE
jgi:hypothetical protein